MKLTEMQDLEQAGNVMMEVALVFETLAREGCDTTKINKEKALELSDYCRKSYSTIRKILY